MDKYADAVATLASKIHIFEENQNITMTVIKKTMPYPINELLQPSNYEDNNSNSYFYSCNRA